MRINNAHLQLVLPFAAILISNFPVFFRPTRRLYDKNSHYYSNTLLYIPHRSKGCWDYLKYKKNKKLFYEKQNVFGPELTK